MLFKVLTTALLCLAFIQSSFATPLEGRKYGFEFNIPRLLLTSPEMKGLSGTFSYFNHNNNTEIAIPWLIAKYGSGKDEYINTKAGRIKEDNTPLLNRSFDIHYRKFIFDKLNGLYLSGFTRFSHFDGARYLNDSPNILNKKTEPFSKLRTGFGVGIGYRVFPENGRTYWGAGVIVGRYIDNKNYSLVNNDGPFEYDSPIIIDAELLKFGFSF